MQCITPSKTSGSCICISIAAWPRLHRPSDGSLTAIVNVRICGYGSGSPGYIGRSNVSPAPSIYPCFELLSTRRWAYSSSVPKPAGKQTFPPYTHSFCDTFTYFHFDMVHIASFSALVLASLAFLPSGQAGPACARRNEGSEACLTRCASKWGWSGQVMGQDRWGQVMTRTVTDMGSVLTKACRVRPT